MTTASFLIEGTNPNMVVRYLSRTHSIYAVSRTDRSAVAEHAIAKDFSERT